MARNSLLGSAALLLAALTLSAAKLPPRPQPLSDWTNGTSLLWGGPQDGQDDPFVVRLPPGACGYGEMDPKMWPFFQVVGISPRNPLVQSRPQASCGTCLEVKCVSPKPKVCTSAASVTVVVTDECRDCPANTLNLHALAFQQIADVEYGSTAIQYRQVECSPVDAITVHVDGYRVAQGGWLRLSLKSVAGDGAPVRVELARSAGGAVGSNMTGDATAADAADPQAAPDSAEGVDIDGGVWKPMDNTYGAQWEMSALPSPPCDLRLTDKYGRQVVLHDAITVAGALGEFPGHGQFPGLDNATARAAKQEAARSTVPAGAQQQDAVAAPTPNATAVSAPKPKATAPKSNPAPSAAPIVVRSSFVKFVSASNRRLMQQQQQEEQFSGALPRQQSRGPMP